MPGPYCTPTDVYNQVQARLSQAAASTLPGHWTVLGTSACTAGYSRMIGLLAGRGYSVSLVDQWGGKVDYNLRYSVAYAFSFGDFRKGDEAMPVKSELERIDKELLDKNYVLVDASGNILVPDVSQAVGQNQIAYGRQTQFDVDSFVYDQWGRGRDPRGYIDPTTGLYTSLGGCP